MSRNTPHLVDGYEGDHVTRGSSLGTIRNVRTVLAIHQSRFHVSHYAYIVTKVMYVMYMYSLVLVYSNVEIVRTKPAILPQCSVADGLRSFTRPRGKPRARFDEASRQCGFHVSSSQDSRVS